MNKEPMGKKINYVDSLTSEEREKQNNIKTTISTATSQEPMEWESELRQEWNNADFLSGVPYEINAIKKAIADWWIPQIKQAEEREREKYRKHLETKLVYLEDLEKQHQEQFDIDYSRYNITKSEKDKQTMLKHEGGNSAYRGGVLSGKIEELKCLITLINQNNE